ncbi:SPOSA6832_03938 [Sporobolomyces salmonicolor]|uniref:GPN-loop GTPase 1 n=1 Tax=Sporidiobolus salmonicolor TaxID=5005 RepID=A0A0D6EQY0_SPOSA|nr:SPOSA6832_03938 [Sporobolomyces salmonicolor]
MASPARDTAAPAAADKGKSKESPRATAMIVIGMAGSGKSQSVCPTPRSLSSPSLHLVRRLPRSVTVPAQADSCFFFPLAATFMQRVNSYLHSRSQPPYVLNLDPAVMHLPFDANIDIRDTVDYQEVMKQCVSPPLTTVHQADEEDEPRYNLGPNGGIMTALNLFTTKFDQVLSHVENRANSVDYILLDTPGQIEIFTWSASGSIITDALASALPTVVVYIIDTPRTTAPATFMSNMLYACSILYKTRLPFLLVFNKTDVQSHQFALDWMRDFEAFQEALMERRRTHGDEDGPGYMDSLMNSMSLVLDEFYKHLRAVGVSAMTGEGMDELFDAVQEARKEYETEYKPELEKVVAERERKKEATKSDSMARLMKDMKISTPASASGAAGSEPVNPALEKYLDPNPDEEDEDSDEGEVIDKSARTGYYELPTRKPKRGTMPGGAVEGDDGTSSQRTILRSPLHRSIGTSGRGEPSAAPGRDARSDATASAVAKASNMVVAMTPVGPRASQPEV